MHLQAKHVLFSEHNLIYKQKKWIQMGVVEGGGNTTFDSFIPSQYSSKRTHESRVKTSLDLPNFLNHHWGGLWDLQCFINLIVWWVNQFPLSFSLFDKPNSTNLSPAPSPLDHPIYIRSCSLPILHYSLVELHLDPTSNFYRITML